MSETVKTFYLNVKGNHLSRPDYKDCLVYATEKIENNNSHVVYSTPLFSFIPEGNSIPAISSTSYISFLFFPSIVSHFQEYFGEFLDYCWFSIGLGNLVVFSTEEIWTTIEEKIKTLYESEELTASETWVLSNNKIVGEPIFYGPRRNDPDTIEVGEFPKDIPLDIEFVLNELLVNLNYFLHFSKTYTPHYYKDHRNLYNFVLNEIKNLLTDIREPNGDKFSISDSYGRLVQFNSVLTYVINQLFTGVLPILHSRAFFNRYSLLGSGTAVSGLFEISIQLEEIFNLNMLEDIDKSDYAIQEIPEGELLDFQSLMMPDSYNESIWERDKLRKALITKISETTSNTEEGDEFTRLAFFSGRYGFREYELSASAATQVLVEGSTSKWHILNYTHEVIHNHVRRARRKKEKGKNITTKGTKKHEE